MRFRWVAISLLGSLIGAGGRSAASDVAVLCALDADLAKLRAAAEGPVQNIGAGRLAIARFRLGPHIVHVARMYPGTHDSAVVAAALLARSNARMLITLGPAGGLDDALPPGRWVEIVPADDAPAAPPCAVAAPPCWSNLPVARSASVDRFVASTADRDRLRIERQAQAVEMNLAGLAAAARRFEVVQRHFRIVSDRADERAPEEFRAFAAAYDGAGGNLLAQWLREWPPDPGDIEAWPALSRLLITNGTPATPRTTPDKTGRNSSGRTR